MDTKKEMAKLKKRLKEIAHLAHASKLLSWDREVYMPDAGTEHRAEAASELSGLIHKKILALNSDELLSNLHEAEKSGDLKDDDAAIIRETWRDYKRKAELPEKFVRQLSQLTSEAQSIWRKARENDDFDQFAPTLKKIVEMQQEKAEHLGYEETPYDPLLEGFEPRMTTEKTEKIFTDLRDFLVPLIEDIRGQELSINKQIEGQEVPIEEQKEFNRAVAEEMGYDFHAGRLDASTHPFTQAMSPQDARITTRYTPTNLLSSLTATIHEMGHGLYEQGLPDAHYGTPLAEPASLGVHESQSRLWENHIARSLPFSKWLHQKLTKQLAGLENISANGVYKELNTVTPSLIRVEADEVTYNLHIIIRFELEKALIEGSLSVEELPEQWNEKYEKYLGIEVPNDAEGVLQDIHWSMGSFGYFPTYTFGNLYAAQLDQAMRKEIPEIDTKIRSGGFEQIVSWLQNNIHRQGKRYSAEELIENVTGNRLRVDAFKSYIQSKYGNLYEINL